MEEQIREIVESTFHAWWKSENMSIQDAVRLLVSRLAALLSQGWVSVEDEPLPEQCFAWDAHGKSAGLFQEDGFDSFVHGYSFDFEYSQQDYRKTGVCTDINGNRCGHLTHWMPLPATPTEPKE